MFGFGHIDREFSLLHKVYKTKSSVNVSMKLNFGHNTMLDASEPSRRSFSLSTASARERSWTLGKVPIQTTAVTIKYSIKWTPRSSTAKIYIQQFSAANEAHHFCNGHWTNLQILRFISIRLSATRLRHKSKTNVPKISWQLGRCGPTPCAYANFIACPI